jgi:hypothetical protein
MRYLLALQTELKSMNMKSFLAGIPALIKAGMSMDKENGLFDDIRKLVERRPDVREAIEDVVRFFAKEPDLYYSYLSKAAL